MRTPRNYSGIYTSSSLLDHIASASPTVAVCAKLTPSVGSAIGLTSTNSDLPISGTTYRSATGAAVSQLETAVGTHAVNLELETILGANGITEADLNTPKWQGAEFEVFLVNYETLAMGELVVAAGRVADIRTKVPLTVTVEGRGWNNALQISIGRVTAPLCDAEFGDDRCGLDLAALGYVHTLKAVTQVTSTSVFRVATLAGTGADYFTNGRITFTSGDNAGLPAFEVKTFDNSNGEFTLHRAAPYTIAVGVTITATRGCKKRPTEDCAGTYSNIANFRGFPFIPLERALRVVEG